MKIIGITGRSGSGKGYICASFQAKGIPVLDTDTIVHDLYRENKQCIAELEASFGSIQTPTGEVDRKKLGQIVFSDEAKLKKLNEIVHHYVVDEVDRVCAKLKNEGNNAVLIDAPQLFEAQLEQKCDYVIAVTAPEAMRIERICRRDDISEASALLRLSNQLDDHFFREHADFVIVNDSEVDVEGQIIAILDRMDVL